MKRPSLRAARLRRLSLIPGFLSILTILTCASVARQAEAQSSLRPDVSVRRVFNTGTSPVNVRLAKDPRSNTLYYLKRNGGIYQVNLGSANSTLLYTSNNHGIGDAQGFAIGPDGTMYVVGNNDGANSTTRATVAKGVPGSNGQRTWSVLAQSAYYPRSNTAFDHQFNGIIVSPLGDYVYVNSGSRTDHGEVQSAGGLYPDTREVGLTACVLRLPTSGSNLFLPNDRQQLKSSGYVYAEGTRNTFDFAWNPNGDLIGTENGPDRDMSDELNWIRQGQHYGFPWRIGGADNPQQYSNYDPSQDRLLDPDFTAVRNGYYYNDPSFPAKPSGAALLEPIPNLGPDADSYRDPADGVVKDASAQGLSLMTFTAHRSPLGLVFDNDGAMGADYQNAGFCLGWTRGDATGDSVAGPFKDAGQDLLLLDLKKANGNYDARVTRIVQGLANPIDTEIVGNKLYVIEYGGQGGLIEITFPATSQATIARANTAPTIDGTMETVWDNVKQYGTPHAINNAGTITGPLDFSGTWRAMWDDTNLYFFVRIYDESLRNDSTSPYDDDNCEIFFDGDNSKGTTYDGVNDFEWVYAWNDPSVIESNNRGAAGIQFAKLDVPGGWQVEWKIPWSTAKTTPALDKLVGLDVHIEDDDDGGLRDGKRAWWDSQDLAWQNPSLFGTAKLGPEAGSGGGTNPPPTSNANIAAASSVPSIDGSVDSVWSSATGYSPGNITFGTFSSSSDLSATWKGLWDNSNLYALVEITDDDKRNDSTNPWEDDSVEVYVDGNNEKSSSYDSNDRQYIYGWGDGSVVEGGGRNASGVIFAKADPSSTSYRIETRIPWSALGVSGTNDKLIGFDIHLNDDDGGGSRDGKKAWYATADDSWSNPSTFGTATLLASSGGGTPPPAPTNLTATAGNGQVELNWTASSGTTSYNVKRSTTTGSGYATVGTSTDTAHTDSGLTNGTTYYYVVSAVNSSGESGNSNQTSATPTAPSGRTTYGNGGNPWSVSSSGTTRIEAENYDTGGQGVAYNDSDATNNGGAYRTSEGVDVQATTDTGGGYNVGYINAGEWIEHTVNVASAGTYDIKLRVARQPTGTSTVRVLFGGADKTGSVSVPSTGAWQTFTTISTAVNLSAGQQIMRIDMVGGSFNLNWVELSAGATPPPAPTNLAATAGNGQVSLSWTGSSGANSYNVKRSTTNGGPYSTVATGVSSTSHTNTGLTNGTTYYYVVSATNSAGESGNSNQASATPQSSGGSAASITRATSTPILDGNMDAVWSTATAYNMNNVIAGSVSGNSDLSGNWRGLWDGTHLHLLVNVTDDRKRNDSTNVWDDDSVEVFVDGNNSKGNSYDANDVQYGFGWGDSSVTPGTNAGGKLTGVVFAKTDPSSTSYRIEIRIPWSTIGVTPTSGGLIGIEVQADDDDNGGSRDGKKAWWGTTDNAWNNPGAFGTGTLSP